MIKSYSLNLKKSNLNNKFSEEISDEGVKFSQIINSSINSTNIIIRHNYELVDGILQYRMEVNPNQESHEEVDEASGELVTNLPLSFTERFFIRLGH